MVIEMGSGAGRIRSCGDGCIVLPPRPCRPTRCARKVVTKRLQPGGLSSGRACPAAAPPSPPPARCPTDRRGRRPDARRRPAVRARAGVRHRRARLGVVRAGWVCGDDRPLAGPARGEGHARDGGRARCRRSRARRGGARRQGPRARHSRAGRPYRADRCRRRARRGAVVRGRPRRRRPAPSRGPRPGVVHRSRRPPRPGLLAARPAAWRGRPSRDRARAGGGLVRQPRPRVDRPAPGSWPAGRTAARQRSGAGPPVRDRGRGGGTARPVRRRGAARVRAPRGR